MHSLAKPATTEILVKGSRFIAHLERVESKTAIDGKLAEIRRAFPQATHYCHAYVIGAGGETQKAVDDGEPARTAGIPILDILKKSELTDALLVVVRYFAGVKLEAGGLIRAYSQSARAVVALIEPAWRVPIASILVEVPYSWAESIEKLLGQNGVVLDKNYTDKVVFGAECVHDQFEALSSQIKNHTNNNAIIRLMGMRTAYLSKKTLP